MHPLCSAWLLQNAHVGCFSLERSSRSGSHQRCATVDSEWWLSWPRQGSMSSLTKLVNWLNQNLWPCRSRPACWRPTCWSTCRPAAAWGGWPARATACGWPSRPPPASVCASTWPCRSEASSSCCSSWLPTATATACTASPRSSPRRSGRRRQVYLLPVTSFFGAPSASQMASYSSVLSGDAGGFCADLNGHLERLGGRRQHHCGQIHQLWAVSSRGLGLGGCFSEYLND